MNPIIQQSNNSLTIYPQSSIQTMGKLSNISPVFWFTQYLDDVPEHDEWLSGNEREVLSRMRFPKRRSDWRLGRWTAKCALRRLVNECNVRISEIALWTKTKIVDGESSLFSEFAQIEIRAAADGAPEIFVCGDRPPIALSISHRDEIGFCVMHPSRSSIGCDVELVEPHGDAFIADYFTGHEQRMVTSVSAVGHPLLETIIWSAKESALKMLRQGLRLDTRCVEVNLCSGLDTRASVEDPLPLKVKYAERDQSFDGWWRRHAGFVQTVVVPWEPGRKLQMSF